MNKLYVYVRSYFVELSLMLLDLLDQTVYLVDTIATKGCLSKE